MADANTCVFPCSNKRRCTLGAYYCDQCREDMPGVECQESSAVKGATCTNKEKDCDYDTDCVCTDGLTGADGVLCIDAQNGNNNNAHVLSHLYR